MQQCDSTTGEKGETMKSMTAAQDRNGQRMGSGLFFLTLAIALCIAALALSGCTWRQPGETRAEIDRRHERALRLNNEMMLSDLDKVLMLDRPSRLTDKRVP
jgi:hypothetical protein